MELFYYDAETGIFTRKVSVGGHLIGDVAGRIMKDGYVRIGVDGSYFSGHRLAWLYVYGELPEFDLDHFDRVRNNNGISNLRPATKSQNMENKTKQKNNTSGVKGITWHKQCGKWQAVIGSNRTSIYLGLFATLDAAAAAYVRAAKKFHTFNPLAQL